jgi:hypothetical protein
MPVKHVIRQRFACPARLEQIRAAGGTLATRSPHRWVNARYYDALEEFEPDVARNVTENLWERHIKVLFMD